MKKIFYAVALLFSYSSVYSQDVTITNGTDCATLVEIWLGSSMFPNQTCTEFRSDPIPMSPNTSVGYTYAQILALPIWGGTPPTGTVYFKQFKVSLDAVITGCNGTAQNIGLSACSAASGINLPSCTCSSNPAAIFGTYLLGSGGHTCDIHY